MQFRCTESTAHIGKKRMANYIDNVLNHLAEMGIFPEEPSAYIVGKYKTLKQDGTKKEKTE